MSSGEAAAAPTKPRQKRMVDFETNLGRLGSGAFGQVNLVRDKETGKLMAMKVLSKTHIVREKKLNYVKVERDAMSKLNHPNIVRLALTFQDPQNLYYVVEYAAHGDLQTVLNDKIAIDLEQSKITLGQILLAIAHMHQKRILHRDLKPGNILLDAENRVKITDFGTAKIFGEDTEFRCDRGSFVGSADYVSPEVLKETEIGPASDLWSFGCIIYAMLVGHPPFHAESDYAIFQKIEKHEYTIPDFVPEDAKDLITRILQLEPKDRFGNGTHDSGYEPIRNHPFFSGIDWATLPKQGIPEFHSYPPAVEARKKEMENEKEEITADGEAVVREGIVCMKDENGEAAQMTMLLTDRSRLLLTDLAKGKVKGEVNITPEVQITKLEPTVIKIVDGGETYEVVVEEAEVDSWIEAIKAAGTDE